jgi:hypothetical protein
MIGSIAKFLKHHRWAVFLAHQSLIFVITGRNIHLGRDPVGLIDGAALVALSAGLILKVEGEIALSS